MQESELEGCSSLRHVLVGGEALPPVLAARFGQRLPNAHLHNAYGPTETTVDATGVWSLQLDRPQSHWEHLAIVCQKPMSVRQVNTPTTEPADMVMIFSVMMQILNGPLCLQAMM